MGNFHHHALRQYRHAQHSSTAVDPPEAWAPDCDECGDAMSPSDDGDGWTCANERECEARDCGESTHTRCSECGEAFCAEHLDDGRCAGCAEDHDADDDGDDMDGDHASALASVYGSDE